MALLTGEFEALCPDGYGYVPDRRGDGTEGLYRILCLGAVFTTWTAVRASLPIIRTVSQ